MTPEHAFARLRSAVDALPERAGSIGLEFDEDLAVVTIDNPHARNALTGRMMLQLHEQVERLLEWALPDGLSGQGTLGDLAEGFERRTERLAIPLGETLVHTVTLERR